MTARKRRDHGVLPEQEVAELEFLEDVGVNGKTRADPLAS
jgi:hypothetical protein